MDDRIEGFLKSGVFHYADALNAVEGFRREMRTRLEGILTRYAWRHLVGAGDQATVQSDANGAANWGNWVWAGIDGKTRAGRPRQVSIGIWWGAPRIQEQVVLYAHATDGNERLRFSGMPKSPRVRIETIGDWTRVLLVPTPDVSFDEDFNLLLGELEDKLDG